MTCRKCVKRSGWLLAVPAYLVIPKCPLCLLAYLAVAQAALWRNWEAIAAAALIVAGVIGWVTFRSQKPIRAETRRDTANEKHSRP